VSFAAITLCVASQRVFFFVVYFVIDSVRELLDTPSYYAVGDSTSAGFFPSLASNTGEEGKLQIVWV
jgi:hypothetical protein